MPDTAMPATPGPEPDVVDLLLTQHAQIEELFLLVTAGEGDTRRDAFGDLVRMLAVHETAEEEVIHPLSRTLPGGNDDMIDERLDEERQAKETLKTLIKAGIDADGFDEGMLLLRKSVLEHARHEERYEFPRLRQHVPPDRLRLLAGAVLAAEAAAPTRPHPGAESATANAVAGLPLAVIDRIRDAARGAGGTKKKKSASATASGVTRDELYERAKQAGIPGRSTMTKQELADALEETT